MTNISNNEDFLKELLSPREPEKAPEGFADRVMAALPAAPARQKASWWQQSNAWIWASIVAGIISLVVIAFTLDFSFMGSIFTGIRFDSSLVDTITREFGRELLGLTDGFTLSPISIIIVVALGALFLIDRLIRRRPKIEMRTF